MEHGTGGDTTFLDDLWGDLIVSILAVNNYSIEKAYACRPGLIKAGLCSPENLSNWNTETIAAKLVEAECNRGSFMTPLYARRLASLGAAVKEVGIAQFQQTLSSAERRTISDLLLPINGIGPAVLKSFFLLREIR